MKKKVLAIMFSAIMAVSVISCGKTTEENKTVTTENSTEVNEESKTAATEESSVKDNSVAFKSYLDGMTKLADTTFKINGGYDENDGIYGAVEAENGVLYWLNSNDHLITAEYDAANNCLTYKSLAVNDAGEIDVISEISLEKLITFDDKLKILFSEFELEDGRDVIMVESRGLAYTYADGVEYGINLIEIKEDGTLSKFFEDGVAGSGDEDITSDVRSGFNKAVGHEYSKDEFDDIFYNDKLFIEQEGKPVNASIEFTSETSKFADDDDWDSINAIVQKIYDGMENPTTETVYWGEGKFIADDFK